MVDVLKFSPLNCAKALYYAKSPGAWLSTHLDEIFRLPLRRWKPCSNQRCKYNIIYSWTYYIWYMWGWKSVNIICYIYIYMLHVYLLCSTAHHQILRSCHDRYIIARTSTVSWTMSATVTHVHVSIMGSLKNSPELVCCESQILSHDLSISLPKSPIKSLINQWLGLRCRENLQETMICPMNFMGFSYVFSSPSALDLGPRRWSAGAPSTVLIHGVIPQRSFFEATYLQHIEFTLSNWYTYLQGILLKPPYYGVYIYRWFTP